MNSFGKVFRITIYGESHGETVGVIIDGCPAGLAIDESDFQHDINRRKGNQEIGSTPRSEEDRPVLLSGVFEGKSTGAPINIQFANRDHRSADYEKNRVLPRPGHADWTSWKKYGGFSDYRGGGRFSGRMTLPLVAAGVIAKKLISPARIDADIAEAGGEKDITAAVAEAKEAGDSIGGIIECSVTNLLAGFGEPFFNSVESRLSHIIFSIPGVKGIEFGAGFALARMKGSEANDPIINTDGATATNYSGGINGGITNGNDLLLRIAVKPTPSIPKAQKTINIETGEKTEIRTSGRHDLCIASRMPVIIEASVAISLADFILLEQKIPRVIK